MSASDRAMIGLFEGARFDPTTKSVVSEEQWLIRALPLDAKAPYRTDSAAIPPLYGIRLANSSDDGALRVSGYIRIVHHPGLGTELKITGVDPNTGDRDSAKDLTVAGVRLGYTDGTITGTATTSDEQDPACRLSLTLNANADVKLLGGAAFPAEGMDDFIPTNPIEWVMLTIPAEGAASATRLVGAGYFVSADVANRPCMLYSLIQKENDLRMLKRYEPSNEADGFDIDYTFHPFSVGSQGVTGYAGPWVNEKGMSAGEFVAMSVPLTREVSPAIGFCTGLECWWPPGTLFVGTYTEDGLSLDDSSLVCYDSAFPDTTPRVREVADAVLRQGKTVIESPSVAFAPVLFPSLSGKRHSTGAVVVDALRTFAGRPFINHITNGSKTGMITYTYGDVARVVNKVIETLDGAIEGDAAATGSKPRALLVCGRTNTTQVLAPTLTAFALRYTLVPVPAAIFTDKSAMEALVVQLAPTYELFACACDGDVAEFTPAAAKLVVREMAFTAPKLMTEVAVATEKAPMPKNRLADLTELPEVSADFISAVLFTSGTGSQFPKAVNFAEEQARPSEGAANTAPFVQLDFQPGDPTFALSLAQSMLSGGQRLVCFRVAELMDTIFVGRPTHIGAPPVFWTSLCEGAPQVGGGGSKAEAKQWRTKVRRELGNRLTVATTGGGLLTDRVFRLLNDVAGVSLVNLYGCREAGGIARNGIVYPGVEVQIRDPVSKVFSAEGTGEICVSSPRLVAGYAEESITASAFVSNDGKRFYCTGDLGEVKRSVGLHNEAQTLVSVLGRTSGTLKAPTGTWVSTAAVEAVLETHIQVHQAFIFGGVDNLRGALVLANGVKDPLPAENNTEALHSLLRGLVRHCVSAGISADLVPTKWVLLPFSEKFTAENGFLTGSGKKAAGRLLGRFSAADDEFCSIPDEDADSGPSTPIHQLLRSLLPKLSDGRTASTVSASQHHLLSSKLATLGLDSIRAAMISSALGSEKFPVATVFAMTLEQANAWLNGNGSSTAKLHQDPSSSTNELFWAKALECPQTALDEVKHHAPADSGVSKPGDIVVIGATGFLGPALVAEALTRVLHPSMSDARVISLARGGPHARSRVEEALERYKAALPDHTMIKNYLGDETFLKQRLVVQSYDPSDFSLAETIGVKTDTEGLASLLGGAQYAILNAAAVSHAAPYNALQAMNVDYPVACAVALSRINVPMVFVSSTAVLAAGPPKPSGNPFEAIKPAELQKKAECGDAYGCTKAVAEAQVAQLASVAGSNLRVAFVRPCAITPHSYGGAQCQNHSDAIQRLLKLCHSVGAAPQDINMELFSVPVDLVANVVAAAGATFVSQKTVAVRTYNVAATGPLLSNVVDTCATSLKWSRVSIASFNEEIGKRRASQNKLSSNGDAAAAGEVMLCDAAASFGWDCKARHATPCCETTAGLLGVPQGKWPATPLEAFVPK